uniref:Leucine-rich repeat-containing N-terminal plant-type domain-containing protein n=1 Tax=Populus trichocarpa TaxID=3694 RepID=A0A2K1YDK9_POPTR
MLRGSIPICAHNFYDNALLVSKGNTVAYGSILNIVRSVDLSSNNLSGEVPEEVALLIALQSLNLSHNHFTERIPKKIGAVGSLESLDFSVNQLVGEHQPPPSMSRVDIFYLVFL